MPNSERDVLDRVRAGDARAYGMLVEMYMSKAMTLATRLLRDRRDAEEAVHDAFLRAYKGIEGFRSDSSFGTWFYRILYNQCMTRLSRVRREMESLDNENGEGAGEVPDPEQYSVLDRLADRELAEIVSREIEGLPAGYRAVVVLFYVNDQSYDEICTVTGMPLGTVKTTLHRARELLRSRVLAKLGHEVQA